MTISLNLTTGASRAMGEEECAAFDAPLFVTGAFVVLEVVFWSPPANAWIYLVRSKTPRTFPAGTREVTADEVAAASTPR